MPTLVRQILDHSQEMVLEKDDNDDSITNDENDVEKKKPKPKWSLKKVRRDFQSTISSMSIHSFDNRCTLINRLP